MQRSEHKNSYVSAKSGMEILARRADPALTSLNYVVCCLLSESRGGALSFLLGKLGLFTSCCSFRALSATNCNPQPTKCTKFFFRRLYYNNEQSYILQSTWHSHKGKSIKQDCIKISYFLPQLTSYAYREGEK